MPLNTLSPSVPQKTRREFLGQSAIVATLVAMTGICSEEVEAAIKKRSSKEITPKTAKLSTGRTMEFTEIGEGETPCVFVHGLFGSSNTFLGFDDILKELGIRGIAVNMYGRKTQWRNRSVVDAGHDIAALSEKVQGIDANPNILCCSAGGKDGISACAAVNERGEGRLSDNLFIASAQADLSGKAFDLLNETQQKGIGAIMGISKQGRFPRLKKAAARLKQRIAYKRIAEQICAGSLSAAHLDSLMGPEDQKALRNDPEFKAALMSGSSGYTVPEVIHSIRKLFGWNIDFSKIQGTTVKIFHGTDDRLVDPGNAQIIEKQLTDAGVKDVEVHMSHYGHLLMKVRAKEIGEMIT